ncbi:CG5509, partial [Drosophila busckii]
KEYGFLKARADVTPFPGFAKSTKIRTIAERLKSASSRELQASESKSTSSRTSQLCHSYTTNTSSIQRHSSSAQLTFEMKRKLFNEGEFTLTRGKKLSELQQLEYEPLRLSSAKQASYFDLLRMNEFIRASNLSYNP